MSLMAYLELRSSLLQSSLLSHIGLLSLVTIMSWIPVPDDSHFSLENLPFGIISTAEDPTPRAAIAIGESVLDLKAFASGNGFSAAPEIHSRSDLFSAQTLNPFAAAGRPFHRQVRAYLRSILAADTPHPQSLRDNQTLKDVALLDIAKVQSHMPMQIGDYTDFYAGKNHAYNVGVLFRGPENALQSNYTHLPVGYHGRASSVVVSGTPIRRPWGQTLKDPKADPKIPAFGPCERLDIELEMGMFFCRGNELGEPIPVNEADDYIFGYVLMNDWSARDVQAWEYVPLGPFTSKNLGTSISPWVVLADALEQHKVPALPNDSKPQPYLAEEVKENVLDIDLEVELLCKSRSPSQPRTLVLTAYLSS